VTQKFGIHCINGLPNSSYDISSTNDIYNIQLIENLPDSIARTAYANQMKRQSTSSVYIASDPAGTKIFIDDIEQIGFDTPSMITDIQSGHHGFRLTYPGYEDIESEMPLEPGKTYNIFLTMRKTASSLALTSTSDTTSTDISGIVVLFALGLIGYFILRKGRND
jgi:PEGA domain